MNRDQFLALLWLRWRLTVNAMRRHGELSLIISMIFLCFGALLAVAGAMCGVLGGWLWLATAAPVAHLITWDIVAGLFLLFWILGLVSQLQRAEILDLRQLLHYPVSLRSAFLLNYASSLCVPSVIFCLPCMLGLALGLSLGGGFRFLLLFPLVLGFLFSVSAWTYCLQGWLAVLMENPRRRRNVIMTVTLVMILLFQLPNLLGSVSSRRASSALSMRDTSSGASVTTVLQVHAAIPVCWLPYGARMLAAGNVWPAAGGALGLWLLGGWGLCHAYRGTLRHYRGEGAGRTVDKTPMPVATSCAPAGVSLVEWEIPLVPDDAAAMAMASLRSMLRAPEVRMTLGTNVAGMLILGMANLLHHNTAAIPVLAKPFIACGMVAVSFFGVGTLMTNQFGYDRDGFRMLVLLPTPRWRILLGRNLSLAAVAGVIFLIFLSLGGLLIHLGPVEVLLALLSFVSMFLIYGTLGNLSSVLAPFRIPAGAVQARKVKGLTTLLLMFFSLVSLAVGGLIFVPPLMGWLSASAGRLVSALVTLACAAALTGGTLAVYWTSLKPLGRLLQARERQILDVVTREKE